MPGLYSNGMPVIGGTGGPVGPTTDGLVAVDTEASQGQSPQTVAYTAFQIAALASSLIANTGTTSGDAVTLNTFSGNITSESKTTAVGASWTITLTNSTIAATSTVQAIVRSKTNTIRGAYVSAITPASGSCTIVITNGGTAALNGTFVVPFNVT